jgi:hypothetical protein
MVARKRCGRGVRMTWTTWMICLEEFSRHTPGRCRVPPAGQLPGSSVRAGANRKCPSRSSWSSKSSAPHAETAWLRVLHDRLR